MSISKLSASETLKSPYTEFKSMNAGNQYGAMVPIASATGSSPATDIVFANIPQSYQDLRLVVYSRTSNATTNDSFYLNFNSDAFGTSNYSSTYLRGNGSSVSTARAANTNSPQFRTIGASATSGIFGSTTIDILSYSNLSTFKTAINRDAADANGSGETQLQVFLYRQTNPITSMLVAGNWVSGSTLTLYGIRAVSS